MTVSRTTLLFIAAMIASTIATLAIRRVWPGASAFVMPPFAWPLFGALIFDLATMPLARRGHIEPLNHTVRVFGVIGAALAVMLAPAF